MSKVAKAGLDSLSDGSMYSQSTDSRGACTESEMSRWVCCEKYCCSVVAFLCLFSCGSCQAWPAFLNWVDNTAFIFVCCLHVSGYKMHCEHAQLSIPKNIWCSPKHQIGKKHLISDPWPTHLKCVWFGNYFYRLHISFFTFTFSQLHTHSQNRDLKCRRKP